MPQASFPLILQITTPQGQTAQRELAASPTVIGRLPDCDIQLDSQRVSRRHAQLVRDDLGRWLVRDLDSRNHTRVNGEIVAERLLENDDLIEIGQFQLRVLRLDGAPEPMDSPTTAWSAEQPESTDIRTLSSSPAQRLNAWHLTKVNALGQRLAEIPDSRQRLVELCQALVEQGMSCNCAVALRIARQEHAQPQLLCPYQLRAGGAGQAKPPVPPPGISRAVVQAAVEAQQPVLAGGAIASGLTVSFSDAERGVTAIIACPLRIESTIADILYATVPHDFGTLDWLALVTLACEQYKKAELQIEARKTTQDNAAIRHELQKARKIQMSLVPLNPTATGLEVAIGFEPCLWIGGDYANVLAAPDGRVLMIVADVSGKGLPAAMVATGVHSVVDGSVGQGKSLAEMAQGLNRFLINSMDRQSHLTVLAVLFDPRTGHAEYLNAGHPPILVVRPDGDVRELNWGCNPPLGVLPTSPIIDTADLQPAELLFLYTDGVSEMYDAAGKMLGVQGVKSRLGELYSANSGAPLAQLRDRLSQKLDEIRGPSPATDDRTFLLARRL
ncbi:MAG: SpoIIE family protein phosphatase [Tepidisphaeraceae bacterium]|jgi:serine phosphatase RsbU (regulator of sigma subunit)